MGSLFDYLNWRGDLSFSQSEINDVDSLIFSLLSYVDFRGIVPSTHETADAVPLRTAINAYFAKNPDPKKISLGVMVPKAIFDLIRVLKETKRFRNVGVKAHVNIIDLQNEMQFSATTFLLDDQCAVVAFRGTDDTLVGWKENFNMSFMDFVPAQKQAVLYLEDVALHFGGRLYLTGHSKGGNLAVYSAVRSRESIQNRIDRVWSNDGPGFSHKMLDDPDYIKIRPLIRTLIPQSSIVGILLEHEENYTVVKSRQKGPMQHDGLTWEVMGDSFVCLQTVTDECKRFDKTLNQWINQMTKEQREEFSDALYQILSIDNALTLTDLVSMRRKWLARGKDIDPHVYKSLSEMLTSLINLSAKNFIDDIRPKKKS